jgi:acetyl-CoA carboxylase biotin carboxyl carrier protein
MWSSPPWWAHFTAPSSPESGPFVEVGSVVKEGETICIIEAMKILNEIEADKSGTITKIHAQNAQAVEYGSALFRH